MQPRRQELPHERQRPHAFERDQPAELRRRPQRQALRQDCRIDWVEFSSDNRAGTVTRTLQDSRLVDPLSAKDNDNHGTESYLLTVADYGGKQMAQYRYGPVIFLTNPGPAGNSVAAACQLPAGCPLGAHGNDAFEFGGAYSVMGRPFRFTSANVP